MKKVVIGIDASLNSTGVCVLTLKDVRGKKKKGKLFRIDNTKDRPTKMRKWEYIVGKLSIFNNTKYLEKNKVLGVIIENYSYGFRGSSLSDLAEVQGLIRFFMGNFKIFTVAPKTLKKFVIGPQRKGSKKDLMLKYIFKKWDIDIDQDDEADAYALARLGVYKFYKNKLKVLEYENECIDKITRWN